MIRLLGLHGAVYLHQTEGGFQIFEKPDSAEPASEEQYPSIEEARKGLKKIYFPGLFLTEDEFRARWSRLFPDDKDVVLVEGTEGSAVANWQVRIDGFDIAWEDYAKERFLLIRIRKTGIVRCEEKFLKRLKPARIEELSRKHNISIKLQVTPTPEE